VGFCEDPVGEFLLWLAKNHPTLRRVEDVTKQHVLLYRVHLAERPAKRKTPTGLLSREAQQCSQRALRTFFGWAADEDYRIDDRILKLDKIKLPDREADLFHLALLSRVLSACSAETENVIVRILVGSGARISEVPGISRKEPDGLPDLTLDSLDRGHTDLRLRWDERTQGLKTRRVQVCTRLVTEFKRFEARHRPETRHDALMISQRGEPFETSGIDSLMDRLQRRVGFRVHARTFHHTFGTVPVQLGRISNASATPWATRTTMCCSGT